MSRRYFIAGLYVIILLLLFVNLFIICSKTMPGRHSSAAFWFYFDLRGNFPFYFSSLLLAANVFLLFRIAGLTTLSKDQIFFWKILLITFSLFAIDEAFYIHQHFKMSTFGTIASYDQRSWTHYLWVIPYFFVFGVLFVILFKKAKTIEPVIRRKLLFAGIVFLTGVVCLEFAGTFYDVIHPKPDIYLFSIKTAEGVFQLVGSVMFFEVFSMQAYPGERERPIL